MYYLDITLIPQEEINPHFIWHKLYTQLHFILVNQKDHEDRTPFGFGFPEYKYIAGKFAFLGKKLRIFAQTESDFSTLNIREKLDKLADYVHISSVKKIPENKITGYACFARLHTETHSGAVRMANRQINKPSEKQKTLDFYLEKTKNPCDLPYVMLKSHSTNQEKFPLFIQKIEKNQENLGTFNTYGLSKNSTLPVF